MHLYLIIARHGNTFEDQEIPKRIGSKTDLPLTAKGRAQAQTLGCHLKTLYPPVLKIYAAPLRRTMETAQAAAKELGYNNNIEQAKFLTEIDHGPDENKTDSEILSRNGPQALKQWDEFCQMPPDWSPRPEEILISWNNFFSKIAAQAKILKQQPNPHSILLVTSNGIARFAVLAAQKDKNLELNSSNLKLSTGSFGVIEYSTEYNDDVWTVRNWNTKPTNPNNNPPIIEA